MIRATNLHENTIESVRFDPELGSVLITLVQSNESWIDPEGFRLELIFSEIVSFAIASADLAVCRGTMVDGIACTRTEAGYFANFILRGDEGSYWAIQLIFGQLRYHRTPWHSWER